MIEILQIERMLRIYEEIKAPIKFSQTGFITAIILTDQVDNPAINPFCK